MELKIVKPPDMPVSKATQNNYVENRSRGTLIFNGINENYLDDHLSPNQVLKTLNNNQDGVVSGVYSDTIPFGVPIECSERTGIMVLTTTNQLPEAHEARTFTTMFRKSNGNQFYFIRDPKLNNVNDLSCSLSLIINGVVPGPGLEQEGCGRIIIMGAYVGNFKDHIKPMSRELYDYLAIHLKQDQFTLTSSSKNMSENSEEYLNELVKEEPPHVAREFEINLETGIITPLEDDKIYQEKLENMIHCQEHKKVANYFTKKYIDDVKVIDPRGPVYLFNKKTILWDELTIDQFAIRLSDILEVDLDKESGKVHLKLERTNSHEEKVKLKNYLTVLGQLYPKLCKFSYVKSIAQWICNDIANIENSKIFDDLTGHLPVKGGQVIDLKANETCPRTRDHYFTYEISIKYVPGKTVESLTKFISQIMLEDNIEIQHRVKSNFLQRLVGYAITGECNEKIMPVFSGEQGNNGKTTFCDLILSCLPRIAKSAHKNIIMKRNNPSSANLELHMLRGSRIALVSETQENEYIDEDIFKRMTGAGDEVQSRNLFMNFVSWKPNFVPFMITNHVPKCTGHKATLNRILIFKFMAEFVENPIQFHQRKIDKNISKMWSDEDIREAFLAWTVAGAVEFYKNGLNPPREVLEATEEYRRNMDSVQLFIEEKIDPTSGPNDRENSTNLYNCYKDFCENEDFKKVSHKAFAQKLSTKPGVTRERKNDGSHYCGIKLIQARTTSQIAANLLSF
jgi:P4 family phage/plasmid primase-like protien